MAGLQTLVRRWSMSSKMALALAVVLLLAALGLAFYNERLADLEKARQGVVQAEILSASVAGALAFDDADAAREYVAALAANTDIRAAAAYEVSGRRVAGFSRDETSPPPTNQVGAPRTEGPDLIVTAKVAQGRTQLGSVYLRIVRETLVRRATRYLGIAVLIVMASLVLTVLGASNASLAEAHRKLQREVEEREKAEEALRQSQKMETMGQLTGGVAHDFNNLLMAASSGLDLLERTADPARQMRLKQGIRQAIDRGASLTQQLLAFARRTPMNPEVVDLGVRLQAITALLDRSLREDINVEVQAAQGLWLVELDPAQLEVAILNVALNARDAMPNGGRILISADNLPGSDGSPDRVRVRISDTGFGMTPEVRARVFEPFFTTKGVGRGTGLGLSQVYGFARASGGEVNIESEPDRGATLTFLLPRTDKPLDIVEVKEAPVALAAMGRRQRILLVEDDESVARMVEEMLKELGYEAEHAQSAEVALDTLRSNRRVDLVFSDMIMPGEMDGMALAREIARRRPELPVVLTTGYSAAAATAAAEGLRLLVKPYRIDTLANELEAALRRRRPH